MENDAFQIKFTEEAQKFLDDIPDGVADKMLYNISRAVKGERNKEIFKKLENTEIWESRAKYNKMAYRLLAFWDTDEKTLVIATHGIIKKTQKTPSKEIKKAEKIMKEYFKSK
jgi:phage-related protein